jgi:hypothetical protein
MTDRSHEQETVEMAVSTVARPENYIQFLLDRLDLTCGIRLVVGGPESGYLERYRGNPQVEILEVTPEDWTRVQNHKVHHRASWNYWRSLSLCGHNQERAGLIVFEDDVVPAHGWQSRFFQIVQQLQSEFGSKYVLALYSAHNGLPNPHDAHVHHVPYQIRTFFGTQAMYYPESVRIGWTDFLEANGVITFKAPYDLLLKEYLVKEGIPLFAASPSLVQHIGRVGTGLGAFHQAIHYRDFII